MNNGFYQYGALLRQYRVNYVSGLKQFPKIRRKLSLLLYAEGFAISGKAFPFIWIPYQSVVDFKLSNGYGSYWSYAGVSDALYEKMIHIGYSAQNKESIYLILEMAVSCFQMANYKASSELLSFVNTSGISARFHVNKPVPQDQNADIYSQIEKLAELHHAGILTDEEFTAKKAELLKRI